MTRLITSIGLEVHAELATESKVFCSCPTRFGAEPNTQVCPVCLGLPGVLPVLNERVVDMAIATALALDCRVSAESLFDRKNYYYPDLPKGYQISQDHVCFATDGWLDVEVGGRTMRVAIGNIHIEEDTGKNVHAEDSGLVGESLVDFNRSGVPLLEIVTGFPPTMHAVSEAEAYMNALRELLRWIGVSDCKMEEGSLRFEANISVAPEGADKLGPRVEIKNLNSIRAAVKALSYEEKRQGRELAAGRPLRQETRLWDEVRGMTAPMRSKEEAHDYRYFPEPDLVPLRVDDAWIGRVRAALPELPAARRRRFVLELGIPPYDSGVLTARKEIADLFEAAAREADPKTVSNVVMGEVLRRLKEDGEIPVSAAGVASLARLMSDGTVSASAGKVVFERMWETGGDPKDIVKRENLAMVTDEAALAQACREVVEANPKPVEDYRAGNKKAIGALVGQVMQRTRGKADPKAVNRLLAQMLEGEQK